MLELDLQYDDLVGRRCRPVAALAFEIEDVAGGDGVEGEAPAEVIGVVEPQVLDADADLEDLEVFLDGPATLISGDDGFGDFRVGLAFGAQEQPVEGFPALGRVGLGGGQMPRTLETLQPAGTLSRSYFAPPVPSPPAPSRSVAFNSYTPSGRPANGISLSLAIARPTSGRCTSISGARASGSRPTCCCRVATGMRRSASI